MIIIAWNRSQFELFLSWGRYMFNRPSRTRGKIEIILKSNIQRILNGDLGSCPVDTRSWAGWVEELGGHASAPRRRWPKSKEQQPTIGSGWNCRRCPVPKVGRPGTALDSAISNICWWWNYWRLIWIIVCEQRLSCSSHSRRRAGRLPGNLSARFDTRECGRWRSTSGLCCTDPI